MIDGTICRWQGGRSSKKNVELSGIRKDNHLCVDMCVLLFHLASQTAPLLYLIPAQPL